MDWVEHAHQAIDEDIIKNLNEKDWIYLKDNYKNKSDNMKSLIAGHIHLSNVNLAEIELQTLTKMVIHE
ncbi:hypothetical protein Q4517_10085 [Tenacibaculum sp. 1_MG-2023]|uniref:hypothetical protein n=1 Tax=Tenacibaculum sp. 1_MG-2023 TaxID=3062653 RepID=UPI0026E23368|nr:hypothetical protein [Tenacibaculum sp. 1_MG-2023]MDO6675892.1 hypothetical protein [Tenacibaculum sp. 1_MG-2023]